MILAKLLKAIQYLALPFQFRRRFFLLARLVFTNRPLVGELVRIAPHAAWYRNQAFRTVIDVGAYIGAYAFAVRTLLPQAQLYSFEPQAECYRRLVRRMATDGRFRAFQTALGEERGKATLWKSDFLASSSLLKMSSLHKEAFPHTSGSAEIEVPLSPLDDYLSEMDLQPPVLLKLDVQGYELKVLAGGLETLMRVSHVISEVSYQPLYEGQPLFADLYAFLGRQGFIYAGSFDSLVSPVDGSILQSDALFVRI